MKTGEASDDSILEFEMDDDLAFSHFGDFIYELLDDGTAMIMGYRGNEMDLELPSIIDDRVVSAIGYAAFFGCTELTSITIPGSVTSIGENAFEGCTGLTRVRIPDGTTSIGERAFACCTNLESILLPHRLTSLRFGVFSNCPSLLTLQFPKGLKQVGARAFERCEKMEEVVLPDGVEVLSEGAFFNCLGLKRVVLPASLRGIERAAFYGCDMAVFEAAPNSYAEGWLNTRRSEPNEVVTCNAYGEPSYAFSLPEDDETRHYSYGENVLEWRDESGNIFIPEVGQEPVVWAHYPFYGVVGSYFRAAFYTHSPHSFADRCRMVDCQLLEICTREAERAKIRIRVIGVYSMMDTLRYNPLGITMKMKAKDRYPIDGSSSLFFTTEWDNSGWMLNSWNEQGDWGGSEYIYTDERDNDHLLKECCFGDFTYYNCFTHIAMGNHEVRLIDAQQKLMEKAKSALNGHFWFCPQMWCSLLLVYCRLDMPRLWLDIVCFIEADQNRLVFTSVTIGDNAFHSSQLREVLLPREGRFIGQRAFSGCPNLNRVIIPDGFCIPPESIAPNAFDGCQDKLTFSVSEKNIALIDWLEQHGHCVEKRPVGAPISQEPRPELSFEIDNPTAPRPKLGDVSPNHRYHDLGGDIFYESDGYKCGWDKFNKPNRGRKQNR